MTILETVKRLVEEGNHIQVAYKSAYVIAHCVNTDEGVQVMTNDGEECGGAPCTAKKSDWIVIRADDNGEPVIDKQGNTDSWVMSDEEFKSRYTQTFNGLYESNHLMQLFVQVNDRITFLAPWGSNLTVDAGGWLNITKKSDVYGMSGDVFDDTYVRVQRGCGGPQFCQDKMRNRVLAYLNSDDAEYSFGD